MAEMTVTRNQHGGFDVMHSGVLVAADFMTYADAFRYIASCDGDPVSTEYKSPWRDLGYGRG